MSVGIYALTDLDEAMAYVGNVPEADGIWIYCSQSDATAATIAVSDLAMTLVITGGTQAGTNTLTFSLAANNTLSEIVSVINALTGWKAGLLYHADADSTDLLSLGAISCLGAANEITLRIKQNYLIEKLIDRATDLIEKYCNRKFMARDYSLERYTAQRDRIIAQNYPIISIIRASDGTIDGLKIKYTSTTANNAYARTTATGIILGVDGTEQAEKTFAANATLSAMATAIGLVAGWTASTLDSTYNGYPSNLIFPQTRYALNADTYLQIPDEPIDDYEMDADTGIVDFSGGLGHGFKDIFVSYRGGYAVAPASLEMVCLELVKLKYQQIQHDLSIKSESLGDYSYTLADIVRGLPDDIREVLNYYRRRIIT